MKVNVWIALHTSEEHASTPIRRTVPRCMCYRPAALLPYLIPRLRPVALRPTLSRGLPLTGTNDLIFIVPPTSLSKFSLDTVCLVKSVISRMDSATRMPRASCSQLGGSSNFWSLASSGFTNAEHYCSLNKELTQIIHRQRRREASAPGRAMGLYPA